MCVPELRFPLLLLLSLPSCPLNTHRTSQPTTQVYTSCMYELSPEYTGPPAVMVSFTDLLAFDLFKLAAAADDSCSSSNSLPRFTPSRLRRC